VATKANSSDYGSIACGAPVKEIEEVEMEEEETGLQRLKERFKRLK
jgi:hypothetical protein